MLTVLSEKGGSKVPEITGLTVPGDIFISVNTTKLLDDIYVKHNKFITRTNLELRMFSILGRRGIIFMPSEDKNYAP